jgi:hypothetical protein
MRRKSRWTRRRKWRKERESSKDYAGDKKTHTTVIFYVVSNPVFFRKAHYTKNILPNNLDVKGLKL